LEQKLVHLLNPLEKNEQSMVKLDSIFKALGVETEKDVRLLAQYFLNHRQYKDLIKNKQYIQKASQETNNYNEKEHQETDAKTMVTDLFKDSSDISNKTVPTESIQLVNQNEVISALKTFVTLHHKSDK
jgi:dynein regulatory complex protein 1